MAIHVHVHDGFRQMIVGGTRVINLAEGIVLAEGGTTCSPPWLMLTGMVDEERPIHGLGTTQPGG